MAAITTVRQNVGDDYVRDGILHLLTQVVPNRQVLLVYKHLPITARPEWELVIGRAIPEGFLVFIRCIAALLMLAKFHVSESPRVHHSPKLFQWLRIDLQRPKL